MATKNERNLKERNISGGQQSSNDFLLMIECVGRFFIYFFILLLPFLSTISSRNEQQVQLFYDLQADDDSIMFSTRK